MYCKNCGGKIDSYANNCPFCGAPVANNNVEATYRASSGNVENYKTCLSWVITLILSCIPVVGFIMMLIWAFGNETKSDPTFRNWARANLILQLIIYITSIIFAIFAFSYIANMFSSFINF